MTVRKKYDIDLLNFIISRDEAKLLSIPNDLTVLSKIQYICKCGNETSKNFRQMERESGAFCRTCTKSNTLEKKKETNITKFGVENPMYNESIKQKLEETNQQRYGVKCTFQNEEVKEKIKKTLIERYNVENPIHNILIKEKIKNTCIKKYGFSYPTMSKEVQEKQKNTNILHYGIEYPQKLQIIKDKIKETCLIKYGVSQPLKNKTILKKLYNNNLKKYGTKCVLSLKNIRDKSKETCLKRYGVEYPNQNPILYEKCKKNATKYKKIVMPSGCIRYVQGFENKAIVELLDNYTENEIFTDRSKVPKICYKMENKTKYYFPDIFIPSENKIIEVKSSWTYKINLEKNLLKQKAVLESGYKYEFWIYDDKGNKTII